MPLLEDDSKEATAENFRELGKGHTYARTKKKSGRKKANKQRVAIVLANKRKVEAKKKHKKGKHHKHVAVKS
jgi:hypothetical protein